MELNPLLQRLSVEQVSEALNCLYHEQQPKDLVLQSLEWSDWVFLVRLLNGLMNERKASSLH